MSEDAAIAWLELREAGVVDAETPNPFAPDWRAPYEAEFTPRERLDIRFRLGMGE